MRSNFKTKELTKKNKGITLIALVITIIVLLILAGVTIVTLTGDNGLITKARDTKETSLDAEIEEEVRSAWNKVYADSYLDSTLDKAEALQTELGKNGHIATVSAEGEKLKVEYRGKTITINPATGSLDIKKPLPEITAGQKAPSNSNATYKSGDYTAIIPAGFTVSATESSIENGLVVTDESNNEWVWIPVSSSDLAKMYTEDITRWNMLGTSVNTKLKTRELTTQNTFNLGNRELERANPGKYQTFVGNSIKLLYREPDVLSSYDTDQTYRTQAGFGDLADMATKLKDDYKNMIDSIKGNGGFYVGRYEIGKDLSNNPQVKAGTVMNNTNWYNLYSACKSFSSGNVESRMIWGCQWDQVCRFINEHGDKVSLDDSTTYGNYNNSIGDAATNKGTLGSSATTGTRNSAWKANNIYDIAGNCWEWTQEAYTTNRRALRGGNYKNDGSDYSVSYRYNNSSSNSSYDYISSRSTLYLQN